MPGRIQDSHLGSVPIVWLQQLFVLGFGFAALRQSALGSSCSRCGVAGDECLVCRRVTAARERRRGILRRGALAAAWLLSWVLVVPAGAQEADPEVSEVEFAGVRALHPDSLRAVIATRGPRCRSLLLAPLCALGNWRWAEQPFRLNQQVLERDEEAIRALYTARGYPAAEVSAEVVPRGGDEVEVRFVVREGEPLVVGSVEVRSERVPPGVRRPDLPLKPGVPYSLPRLEETQRRITSRLAEAGYPFAQVEVGGEVRGDTAEVILRVNPGPAGIFGPARIEAEAPLAEEEVRRRLAFRPGEPFDPAALTRTLARLYDLPVVESVAITPAPSAAGDSVVVPHIVVETRRATGVAADVTVGSTDCVGGIARWEARHFLGEPRVLSLVLGSSNLFADALSESICGGTAPGEFADPSYLARVEWREPAGVDTWLSVTAGYERLAAARAYVRRGAQGRVALSHDFGRGWRAAAGYAPEWSTLDAVRPLYCALAESCAGPPPGDLGGTLLLAPLELSAAWAPRRARRPALGPPVAPDWMLPLAPRWLYSARATLAAAGAPTLSEVSYAHLAVEGALTRLLGRRVEIAGRLRAGVVASSADVLPPQLRLYGGGVQGVRGVAPNLLGAQYLLLRGDPADLPCELRTGACTGAVLEPDQVLRRPFGGHALLESSLEGRVWIGRRAQAAAFVDVGGIRLDDGELSVETADWTVSPGVGLFVISPLGPIRVDLAYLSDAERTYPLIAREPHGAEYLRLGQVELDRFGDGGRVWRRLRVQFYAGLPF